jgi:hypothetical protein
MGRAVAGLDRLKTAFGAFVLVIHHTTKGGGSERGSSALRGAADVMIECEASENLNGPAVTLKCSKMKDAEPFKTFSLSLDKVELANGTSSLVLGGVVDTGNLFGSLNEERIIKIVNEKHAQDGVTYTDLMNEALEAGVGSKSTFDKTLKKIKANQKLHIKGTGKGTLYFPVGVSVKSVS